MIEKSALAGKGGGFHAHPLLAYYFTYKVKVYVPAEWADTITLFHLYQYMYSVVTSPNGFYVPETHIMYLTHCS